MEVDRTATKPCGGRLGGRPRGSGAGQRAHQQRQVEAGDVDQVAPLAYPTTCGAPKNRHNILGCSESRHADFFNGLLGAIEAAAIDRALVRSYTATRRSSGRADGTIDKELRTLRQVLSFAVKEGCIDRAPYIDTPGSGPPRDRWLDKRELNQLIEACVAPHVRAFVLVCVHTGARARQVYNLTWNRVDLWRGLVCFPPSRPRSKKRSVIIPANATLWAELRSLRTVSKSPWVIEHRGHQVSSIKTGFKAAVRRAGIAPCTVHDLRRTCASRLLQRGASFAEVADFLGDSEAMIRHVYGHFSPEGRRATARLLDG